MKQRRLSPTMSLLGLLCACSSGASVSPEISVETHALTAQNIVAQMTLPSTLTSAAFLVAQNKVQLDSGVNANGTLWSAGTIAMQPDAKAQAMVCTGNVVLTDRDTVSSITLGGTLTTGNGDVIGTVSRVPLANVTSSQTFTFPATTQTVVLNSGQSQTLNPGSYVSANISSGATLTLLAGDYYFSSLALESNAVLKLNPAHGATRVFVASSLSYRPTLASGADPSRFFLEYLGVNPVTLETPFWGAFIAPRAALNIGTANGRLHRGSFMAQSIEVQPNAKVEFVLFNATGTTSSCAAGTYDPDGNPFTPCVAKTTCAPGSYVSSQGSTTSDRICAGCASGQFSTSANAASCTQWTTCPAGTYVTNTPSSTVDRVCASCPAGQYSTGNNQSQCLGQTSCPAGTVQTVPGSATSAAVCSACSAGQYCAGGTAAQIECPAGTWDHDGSPSTACTNKTTCVAGTYVANEGTTVTDRSCASCASGSFSTTSNAAVCALWTTCPAGTFATNTPSATLDRTCSPCPEGQYSSGSNQTGCQPQGSCPPGTVQTAAGTATSAAQCEACAPGTFCAGGTSPSTVCPADTWDHDGSSATPCVNRTTCAPGSFVQSNGTTLSDRICAPCQAGTFSTTSNASACQPLTACHAGTFVDSEGSSTSDRTCSACATGQFSQNDNAPGCTTWTTCEAGTQVASAPSASQDRTCSSCQAGTFSTAVNVPECSPLSPPCAAGTFESTAPSATNDRICSPATLCPAGSHVSAFASGSNDTACEACAPGGFTATPNLAAQCTPWTPCGPGQIVLTPPSSTSDTVCQNSPCPHGLGPEMRLLPGGYCIDTTEVTRDQYAGWLATNPNPAVGQDPVCAWNATYAPDATCLSDGSVCITPDCGNRPAVCVDWCDAAAFCKAAGKRLCGKIAGGPNDYETTSCSDPTKSQWYAACSSSGLHAYPYGDTYDEAKCMSPFESSTSHISEVGTHPSCQSDVAGHQGVYDMSGNVWEWEDACTTGTDGAYCHLRGGSYYSYGGGLSENALYATCARCGYNIRNYRKASVGFRCCN